LTPKSSDFPRKIRIADKRSVLRRGLGNQAFTMSGRAVPRMRALLSDLSVRLSAL
jgi:hypothetical protein